MFSVSWYWNELDVVHVPEDVAYHSLSGNGSEISNEKNNVLRIMKVYERIVHEVN